MTAVAARTTGRLGVSASTRALVRRRQLGLQLGDPGPQGGHLVLQLEDPAHALDADAG